MKMVRAVGWWVAFAVLGVFAGGVQARAQVKRPGVVKRAPPAKGAPQSKGAKSKAATRAAAMKAAKARARSGASHKGVVTVASHGSSHSSRVVVQREPPASITDRVMEALSNPAPGVEFARNLAPFFADLKASQTTPGRPVVRIMQFGDSHTAADIFTAAMRNLFQTQFGDGGAGYMVAGYPFAGYRISGTKRGMSTGWSVLGTQPRELGDAMVGLGGLSMQTERAGDWVSLDADAASVTVQYLIQPGGGDIEVYDGETLLKGIATNGDVPAAGVYTAAVTPGPHHFEVRTLEDAPVRLLGWVTENASGVTYEAMGINGVEAGLFLHWNEAVQMEEMRDHQPSLIVLAYGTNEASDHTWTEAGYAEMFRSLIARCKRLAPNAAILVIGPPDRAIRVSRSGWREFDGVDRIIAAQRAVCKSAGCAFWDQRKKMGGFGAMRDWTAIGWAQPDHTHLTGEGYRQMAAALYSDIVQQYTVTQGPIEATNGSTP
jgi:lysophospholipase L1-like esterase